MTDRERAVKYRKEARRYKRKYFELKRATERTGHWIKGNIYEGVYCSECKTKALTDDFWFIRSKCCPNCGARMEENE